MPDKLKLTPEKINILDGTVPVYLPSREEIGRARIIHGTPDLATVIEIELNEEMMGEFYKKQIGGISMAYIPLDGRVIKRRNN